MQNILVTGGAGFIGSHVVALLVGQLEPKVNVFVMDKLDYCSSEANLADLMPCNRCRFIKGDITSVDFVNYVISEHKIDTIIHFAASSHVDNSFGDSFEFTRNNVVGTHVLLEAARQFQISKFVHISTDEVYGEIEPGNPYCTEEAVLAPTNPYAATKAAAENLVMAYFKSFKLPVVITRSNNIYGPHQYPEKIIPKFICSLLTGNKCYIHGDGRNSRHYLYATDVAKGILKILEKGIPGEVYNIGSDLEISNIQLARYLLLKMEMDGVLTVPHELSDGYDSSASILSSLGELTGCGKRLEGEDRYLEFVEDRPFNDKRYAIDSSKLHALGWKPEVSFEQGIKETIEWYRKHWDIWWVEDVVATSLVPHPSKVILRRGSTEN